TLKLFRLSWTSELRLPVLFMLRAFFLFTQGETNFVKIHSSRAGTRVARPRRKLRTSRKIPAPVMRKRLETNCIRDWEKNWLILSVSLLTLDMRSPALFCEKKA